MPGPSYRGDFYHVANGERGRAPHPGCASEVECANWATLCGTREPWNGGRFQCTRTHGHRGDHVAHSGARIVLSRWGRDGSLTDSEEAP